MEKRYGQQEGRKAEIRNESSAISKKGAQDLIIQQNQEIRNVFGIRSSSWLTRRWAGWQQAPTRHVYHPFSIVSTYHSSE